MTWSSNVLNESEIRECVYSDNSEVKKKFKESFSSEVDNFIETVHKAYKLWDSLDKNIAHYGKREAYIVAFLFCALRNMVNSLNLLMSGYVSASGNLVRQYGESVAMAILMSNKSLPFF